MVLCVHDAVLQVVFQKDPRGLIKCSPGRCDLDEDFRTRPAFDHHGTDGADVSFQACQPVCDLLRLGMRHLALLQIKWPALSLPPPAYETVRPDPAWAV